MYQLHNAFHIGYGLFASILETLKSADFFRNNYSNIILYVLTIIAIFTYLKLLKYLKLFKIVEICES
jgi:hypothetical protein